MSEENSKPEGSNNAVKEEVQEGVVQAAEEASPQEVTKSEELKETEPKEEAKAAGMKTRTKEDKIKYLNILVHGDSGVGKTKFAGTMIEAGLKTLYVVFNEDELLTLDQAGLEGYDYYVVTNYEKQLWPLYLGLRRNKPGYQGVVLDGLGDFQQLAKDKELAGDDGVNIRFMEDAMKGGRRMYLQNWGNLLEMTRHFLDPFLKLRMHKIITCISEADDDPKTGKTKIYPGLQGSLQQLIAAHFSVVGYSYIAHWGADTHYCLTTQPHEALSTKDRTNLCQVMINPKFSHFLDALGGKMRKPSDREQKLAKALVVRPQSTRPVVSEKEKSGREKEGDAN